MNISLEQTNTLILKLSTLSSCFHDDHASFSPTDRPTTGKSSIVEGNNNTLPDEIIQGMKDVMDAQSKFIQIVDRFVHNVDDVNKVNIVSDIINTCPQFLSSRNKHGLLPIHTACFRDTCSVYVPLFASTGLKYSMGGGRGRGGLLEETEKGNNVYELLAGSTDAIYQDDKCLVDTMKILMMDTIMLKSKRHQHLIQYYPNKPLLWGHELQDSGFLIKGLTNERFAMTKFLIGLDPIKLYSSILDDEKERINITRSSKASVGTWPIHIACNNLHRNESSYKLFNFLLESGMKHRALVTAKGLDDYLGGLFAFDSRTNETTFELAMKAFGEERTWKCVVKHISTSSSNRNNDDFCILQRALSLPLHYLSGFINRYPRAYFYRDKNGLLPIHHALKEGTEWSTELISIINANMISLYTPDPYDHLPPFALAAAGPKYDLSTIYYMLSLHPEHIGSGMRRSIKHEIDVPIDDSDDYNNNNKEHLSYEETSFQEEHLVGGSSVIRAISSTSLIEADSLGALRF